MQHNTRVKNLEKRLEITTAYSNKEGFNNFSLRAKISIGIQDGFSQFAANSARELPCSNRRTPCNGSYFLERYSAYVVQHKREPLAGSQGLEHDQKSKADPFGFQYFLFGI